MNQAHSSQPPLHSWLLAPKETKIEFKFADTFFDDVCGVARQRQYAVQYVGSYKEPSQVGCRLDSCDTIKCDVR